MSQIGLRRLFIANRGEIARRIALTCKRLGIETVVLTDRDTPPSYLLGVVTDFVRVAEETPALYLNAELMVETAKAAGCDSVHPGFGFLSENAGFAAKCEQAGLIWVGPNPRAIEAMASKATARGYAEKAAVPVVRGLSGFPVPSSETGDFSALEQFAAAAGYPLLLKAAFGGGGKGMRVVTKKDELRASALRAASEAKNSFGNGTLICEQYLTAPRHVEVQILADKHGTVVAVGDRDCSLQRRHQKIIEEAPAPGLTEATREALHEAAVSLAAAVGYDSTGTVEFLVDWSEASRTAPLQRFYFLEMNTRLQVEHPVSEEVFGIDLVEWQLRVAASETLPRAFRTLTPRGHSVEVRIYAEDVRQSFFPAPGPVAAFKPALGPGLRWEIGLDEVDEITGRFDPMIAKLIATGETRTAALMRLEDGLARTVFAGPASNIELLRELATRSAFATAPVTTHFLVTGLEPLLAALDERSTRHTAVAERLLDLLAAGTLGQKATVRGTDPDALTQSIFAAKDSRLALAGASDPASAGIRLAEESQQAAGPGGRHLARYGAGLVTGSDAKAQPFWYAALNRGSDKQFWVSVAGCLYSRRIERSVAAQAAAAGAGVSSEILAPVPGKVIAVKVEPGAEVKAGETVLVLESMKMEFEVKAGKTGTVGTVSVKSGEQVTAGQLLAAWAE